MLDFGDYSKYKNVGVTVGILLNILLLALFLTIFFLFRQQTISSVKQHIFLLLLIVGFAFFLYFKLGPILKPQIKGAKTISILKGINEGFTKPSHSIGNTVNFFLLLLVYLFGVGPISLVSRRRKKSFLKLSFSKRKRSYFQKTNMGQEEKEQYYRQF